ncbi:hypothetical protein FA13DRAFT_1704880 [Coprinellus micaceus]|uniref:Uncharacterized protein n=1 Tax=Coprinellus micaceus TaxID=71717 RepID=A0A4Y7TV15_COPMI|nr:hypothetical protein FA13DRAFT_1704880 [Coprinellus micaceus]
MYDRSDPVATLKQLQKSRKDQMDQETRIHTAISKEGSQGSTSYPVHSPWLSLLPSPACRTSASESQSKRNRGKSKRIPSSSEFGNEMRLTIENKGLKEPVRDMASRDTGHENASYSELVTSRHLETEGRSVQTDPWESRGGCVKLWKQEPSHRARPFLSAAPVSSYGKVIVRLEQGTRLRLDTDRDCGIKIKIDEEYIGRWGAGWKKHERNNTSTLLDGGREAIATSRLLIRGSPSRLEVVRIRSSPNPIQEGTGFLPRDNFRRGPSGGRAVFHPPEIAAYRVIGPPDVQRQPPTAWQHNVRSWGFGMAGAYFDVPNARSVAQSRRRERERQERGLRQTPRPSGGAPPLAPQRGPVQRRLVSPPRLGPPQPLPVPNAALPAVPVPAHSNGQNQGPSSRMCKGEEEEEREEEEA